MIWEQRVPTIVMLTKVYEKRVRKRIILCSYYGIYCWNNQPDYLLNLSAVPIVEQ